jgi:uncharacterized repeat protein (TIGR01451 family)
VGVQAATFTVINTNDLGLGSLRQAITDANGNAGTDTITFAIPGAGVQTITPATALPNITEAVIIDGYGQAGSSPNSLATGDNAVILIELNGSNVSGGTGLNFTAAVNGGEVKGLLFTKWNSAITVNGAKNMAIDGNFFGTNAAGTTAGFTTANSNGLFMLNGSTGVTFGGAANAARNLVSGNTSAVNIGNTSTAGNVVENNYIGTNASGTAALPNQVGIGLNSTGAMTVRNNLVSGNAQQGINIGNLSTGGVLVVGNKIGTNVSGSAGIPNGIGVLLTDGFSGGTSNNVIGTQAEPNVIAFNSGAGVAFTAGVSGQSRQNAIRYNSIFSNGGLGIDLGNDGITPNDLGDGDVGLFNDLQNFPVLTTAQFGAGTVTIAGSLNSKPSAAYNVQFFQSPACDPSGAGEGQTFIGEVTVNTDGAGNGTFNVNFPGSATGVITATATDPQNNTSELSYCAAVTTPAQPSISISDPQVTEGNAATTTLAFTVFLSAASASTVTVNFATANGSASAGSDYTTGGGVVTFTPGQTSQLVNVTVSGDVTPEADETVLVNLTNAVNAAIGDGQGVGTIRNDDALSALTINDVPLAEGNAGTTSFNFTVTLTPAAAFPVTVSYATADNTATAGSDYQGTSGNLIFAVGETTKTVTVLVNGDVTTEPNETFFVNLFNPGNASIGDPQGLGTINNDDANPNITINDPSITEGNSGSKNLTFTITLSNPSSQTISVPFTLADNSANVGSDYNPNSGSFTVIPGAITAQLSVGIIGDVSVEPDETFFVNLGSPANATVTDPQGVGTIINDDGLASPGVSIGNVTLGEGNVGTTTFNFNVALTASSLSTVTVNYATSDNSATIANNDYVTKSGTVTFTPGQTSQTVSITVNGDTAFEPNETFFVNLSSPSNAVIIGPQGIGTINNDDVVGSADVTITKTGPASATPNSNVTYTITVTNNGSAAATAVTVTDVLPAGTSFVSANPSQGSCSGTSTVTCALGTLNTGASATISLTIKMPAVAGSVVNTASVSAAQSDPSLANNSSGATVNVAAAAAGIPALSTWMLALLAIALLGWGVARLGASA